MAQKPSLGKGLASLLPNVDVAGLPIIPVSSQPFNAEGSNKDRHPGISVLSPDEIQTNPYQPRREFDEAQIHELADSIKESGLIQPLIVRKTPDGYQLIAGERRLRAAKLAGLKQIPVVIRRSTDKESLELAIIENIQREDLNCIDTAQAYFRLTQEFGLTQDEVAKKVGKDRTSVANFLRLLRLPEAIIDDLKRGILTYGHGKAILGVEDPDLRLQVRAEVVQKNLSVRETEQLVNRAKQANQAESTERKKSDEMSTSEHLVTRFKTLSLELSRKYPAKVEISGSDDQGKVVFHYSTRQQLDQLIEKFHNS